MQTRSPSPNVHTWRRPALIVNTRSRSGESGYEDARALLGEHGIAPAFSRAVRHPRHLREAVEAALRDGADLVMLGGGDGSIAATIDLMAGSRATFAALPLGTANSFCRTLGFDASLELAIESVAKGRAAAIDLVEIDGHTFVNCAAMGVSPLIGDTIPAGLKRWFGRLGYLFWVVVSLARFRPFRVTVEGPEGSSTCWATEVRLLNGQYHGGVRLSENARLDDGEVVIQIVTGRSRWRLACDWYPRLFGIVRGRDAEGRLIEIRGNEFRISARPAQKVSLDGEVLARTPVALRVRSRAVRVVVPDSQGSRGAGNQNGPDVLSNRVPLGLRGQSGVPAKQEG